VSDERIEVQRLIPASPEAIFAIVSDPQGHVAIDASGMLMGASGEPATKVDDTFVVFMDRESLNDIPLGKYEVSVRIVTFEKDREIAWVVEHPLMNPPMGHVYGYRLEPVEGGTMTTSYYDWSNLHEHWRARTSFPIIAEPTIRATLGILARTVAPQH